MGYCYAFYPSPHSRPVHQPGQKVSFWENSEGLKGIKEDPSFLARPLGLFGGQPNLHRLPLAPVQEGRGGGERSACVCSRPLRSRKRT